MNTQEQIRAIMRQGSETALKRAMLEISYEIKAELDGAGFGCQPPLKGVGKRLNKIGERLGDLRQMLKELEALNPNHD